MALINNPLRVAVIGVGNMGQNHLRVYDLIKGVVIVGVVDSDLAKAKSVAERYGCAAWGSVDEILGKVDAVSVCAPSALHCQIGKFVLENGIACLMEKPLATTEAECAILIEAAKRHGVPLLVGHIERFNPAIRQLAQLLDSGHQVHAVEARRMSLGSLRITDVDVVLDLMVHDLDIALWLMKTPVKNVAASGVHVSNAAGRDYVTALLSFADGVTASLTASRITQTKVRELYLTTDIGYISVNYIAQDLTVHRQGSTGREPSHWSVASEAVLDSVLERVFVRKVEPLVAELQHFIDVVTKGIAPLVTGEQALNTLRVAEQIRHLAAAGHG